MLTRLKPLLPGDRARMMIIAACIGVMTGLAIIAFRESVKLVETVLLHHGSSLLGIEEGGWRRALLPLLPMLGVALLIPLSLAFPGEINGYGFPKFLRRVNLENGVITARTIILKLVSSALTIGSGNSAGTEGPIAQIGGAIG